ncbi:MAG: HEAT repeat domain-containing protein [Planctomycetota bacterium]
MANAPKELRTRIRKLLDRLVQSRRLSNEDQEVIGDEVAAEARKLPRDGVLDALDNATGRSESRRKEAVYLLSEWTDSPAVVDRIGEWISDRDHQWRSLLIQTVGRDGLTQLAPHLSGIIEHDRDEICRDMAIHAAAKLRADECLPALLRLADQDDPSLTWRLATALSSYATEECRPRLRKWFSDHSLTKSTRIFAAWGLGKLGEQTAIDYLIEMLDDPDERGDNYFRPGDSIRAAQAICDIRGWEFEWDKSFVSKTRDLVLNAKSNA